jgi:tRNA(Ile)-lysidine synthase
MHQLQFFGFNKFQIDDILQCIFFDNFGSKFNTNHYQLFVNKNQIEIIELNQQNSFSISIHSFPFKATINELELTIEIVNKPTELKEAQTLYLGLETLEASFQLTSINAGDIIQAFGMKGHKTIGNYFTDKKVSHLQRKNAFKLLVNDQIAALLPFCIDQNFAVTEKTKLVLKISF